MERKLIRNGNGGKVPAQKVNWPGNWRRIKGGRDPGLGGNKEFGWKGWGHSGTIGRLTLGSPGPKPGIWGPRQLTFKNG